MAWSGAALLVIVSVLSLPVAASPPMSAEEVGSLEDRVAIDVEDLEARARLLEFYFERKDFGEWARHELWLIENQPASDLHRTAAGLDPALAERLSAAWRRAVESADASVAVLKNAAKFFQKPVLVFRVEPEYPAAARVAGVVKLIMVIDAAGRVSRIQLEDGHPLLVQAAVDAVKKWRYQPTMANGVAVPVVTQVELPFTPPKR